MEPTTIKVGETVEYFDERGISHLALVTNVFGSAYKTDTGIRQPSINVVYVSDDSTLTDSYGRQIVRQTSAVYETDQTAHGRYWRLVKELN